MKRYRVAAIDPPPAEPTAEAIANRVIESQAHEVPERAQAFLDAAKENDAVEMFRLDAAERRATAFLGSIAIAFTLILGSAGVLLSSSTVLSVGARIAFCIGVVVVLLCLLCAAWHALMALTRTHTIRFVTEDATRRFAEDPRDHAGVVRRAAVILTNTRTHRGVATFKIDAVAVAGRWIALALAVFALTGTFVAVLGATRSNPPKSEIECQVSNSASSSIVRCR
jgi:hypothetical protein